VSDLQPLCGFLYVSTLNRVATRNVVVKTDGILLLRQFSVGKQFTNK
jgi:hypothetical protein